jgi:hypothetical protein
LQSFFKVTLNDLKPTGRLFVALSYPQILVVLKIALHIRARADGNTVLGEAVGRHVKAARPSEGNSINK